MKAIEKIAAHLQPQVMVGDVIGAHTTPQLAAATGLAIATCAKACRALEAEGAAYHMVVDNNHYWFSKSAEALPVVAEPPTLPAPDFSPPPTEPPSTEQATEDPGLPKHIYRPPARFYHHRSAKNRFITRCGIRINDHWRSVDPGNTTLIQCSQCQRAAQLASAHKHVYAVAGKRVGFCKCGARRKDKV